MSSATPVRSVHDALLFECAWEVANKGAAAILPPPLQDLFAPADARIPSRPFAVGGIYTVIKTKAPVTCAE